MLYLNEGPTPIYVGGRLIPPGVAREVDPALIPRPPVATAEDPASDADDTEQPTQEPDPSIASDPGADGSTPIPTDDALPADDPSAKSGRKRA